MERNPALRKAVARRIPFAAPPDLLTPEIEDSLREEMLRLAVAAPKPHSKKLTTLDPAKIAAVRERYDVLQSVKKVAQELNVSEATVRKYI